MAMHSKKLSQSDVINLFSWACLYHFLGFNDIAEKYIIHILQGEYKATHPSIITAAQLLSDIFIAFRKNDSKERRKLLLKLEATITNGIISRNIPKLGNLSEECIYKDPKKTDRGQCLDDRGNNVGYSRDAFKTIDNETSKTNVAFASVIYLIRAYSRIYGQDKAARSFDMAKKSLNDCFQAYQFIWRTYHNSAFSHHAQTNSHDLLTKAAIYEINRANNGALYLSRQDSFEVHCHQSAFFIWGMFLAIDIIKGNINYQIEIYENAKFFYSRALKRFKNVHSIISRQNIKEKLESETILRAIFEKSKIHFDNGQILRALLDQIYCINAIVKKFGIKNEKTKSISQRLEKAINFLSIERHSKIWDKRIICKIFGFGNLHFLCNPKEYPEIKTIIQKFNSLKFWPEKDIITPNEILEVFAKENTTNINLDDNWQKLVSEILSRIGFALLMLRVEYKGNKFIESGYIDKWLNDFFKPIYIHARNYSPIAIYTKTIISDNAIVDDKLFFEDNMDRQLALRIRNKLIEIKKKANRSLLEYLNLLDATTHNIGNLVTIPRRNQKLLMRMGYIRQWNANKELKNGRGCENKFVILKRWQSYNPKLPRPESFRIRGGGYLLIWQGKGIAIDPGYDFIQNLYDEGFAIADIDAVIVTHSHADHDDDLSTLLTMLHEWNEYQEKQGYLSGDKKKIDLFLNESSFRKFTTWVHSEKNIIGRIVPLPQILWDKDSTGWAIDDKGAKRIAPRRGGNIKIDLMGPDGYSLILEIIPAWHNDVLNNTGAIGVKMHLHIDGSPICCLGYTGDTAAFGLIPRIDEYNILTQYTDCDVLVAHLGDARIREIASIISSVHGHPLDCVPVEIFINDFFCHKVNDEWEFDNNSITTTNINRLLELMTALNLIDDEVLIHKYDVVHDKGHIANTIPGLIRSFIDDINSGNIEFEYVDKSSFNQAAFKKYIDSFDIEVNGDINNLIDGIMNRAEACIIRSNNREKESSRNKKQSSGYTPKQVIYMLIQLLGACSQINWVYQNHLGLRGIEALYSNMYRSINNRANGQHGLFIIGELPEELSSYRHRIARWLNTDIYNKITKNGKMKGDSNNYRALYAFTGDIGLHIRLAYGDKYDARIRCDYCNFNNEIVEKQDAYHSPDAIRETTLKALDSRIIYLCRRRDHHPSYSDEYYAHYLYKPEIKRI